MDYKCGLLTGAVDEMEDYKRRPVLCSLGDEGSNFLAEVDQRRGLCQPWGPWTFGSLRKIKVFSFLFGIIATFLIMASYVLTREQKGLLLTPSPNHFRVMSQSLNLSSGKDFAGLKEVVRNIVAKVEFHQRQVPNLQELNEREPQVSIYISLKLYEIMKL